ncbi:MAG: CapA family protein [Planctomycetes bacterium]|nr:CapA family protein [Planctomycetota bacterium]
MTSVPASPPDDVLTLFLCGDVMTGRGIDQILARPCDPLLYEPYVKDARRYCELAEHAHGPIPRGVDDAYIWGEAIAEWNRVQPDVRIVNLETSITTSQRYWQPKGIHYRMHPANIGCLTAANIDCGVLANNHVLDWDREGLLGTLTALREAGIQTAGAGENRREAERPATLETQRGSRVLVFALGMESSGIPRDWAAGEAQPGVNLLADLSSAALAPLRAAILDERQERDVVVVSLHWGGNWGYEVPEGQRRLAHWLIDNANVDLVHGHSSHHVKGIEVYQDRLILYGCGDLVTDYEGIPGQEAYRGDLGLMYFARAAPASGRLVGLEMTPMQMHRMHLRRPPKKDVLTLQAVLNREGGMFGTSVELTEEDSLQLQWQRHEAT